MCEVLNNTDIVGDRLSWIGGYAMVFDLRSSRVFGIAQKCRAILFLDADGKPFLAQAVSFIRTAHPFQSVLLGMNFENSPGLCGGSGLVFNEHRNLSQWAWISHREDSASMPAESLGNVRTSELSEGNSPIALTDGERDKLERLEVGSLGFWLSSNLNSGLGDIETEFMRGFDQYNNMSFLILLVAAILSSTAATSVSSGLGTERMSVILVEAIVVYSFLAIVTHACIVLLRHILA